MDSDVLCENPIHAGSGPQDGSECPPYYLPQDFAETGTRFGFHDSVLPLPFAERGAKLILDENFLVIWASPSAARLASGSSCIAIANGELGGRTRHCDVLLRGICANAGRSADGVEEMLVSRDATHCPELFVRAKSYPFAGTNFTLLTLRNLERDLEGIPDLGRLYGLTRTEQQVTRMMVQGQSVTEISDRLHKSVLTVRTHVKRVYSKLGVGTNEQLFSTVMKLMVD